MRVVVADGHPIMRLGIKALLLPTEMHVVGETGDGEEALRLTEELAPDLVILSLNLTGEVDGFEACRRVKSLPKAPYVLVHTTCDFTDAVSSCLLDEADCLLHKSACHTRLLDAARGATSGQRVWLPSESVGEPRACLEASPKAVLLTEKERDILTLMACGCPNKEMAKRLYLGLPTIKTHVRSILRKFGAKSREDLFRGGRNW